MAKTARIRVPLGRRSYTIEIGDGLLGSAGETLRRLGDFRHLAIITDENVEPLYAEKLARSLTGPETAIDLFVVPAGEESKSLGMAQVLWDGLLAAGTSRSSLVVALGGGVVGDLAGFVAATYARGIPYLQIPTTLLAMVDSSVGGKTGIDLAGGKNMVGAFHQPLAVIIDPETLRSLPEREYRAGLGEVVKYAVSLDAELFEFMERNAPEIGRRGESALTRIIERCCRIKAGIVRADERETTGLRALLNYGHTFAHAYETAGEFSLFRHGEAVALGMLDALRLARRLGKKGRGEFLAVDTALIRREERLFRSISLPTALAAFELPTKGKAAAQWNHDALFEIMLRDKKARNRQPQFVLPTGLGRCNLFADIPADAVRQTLKERLR